MTYTAPRIVAEWMPDVWPGGDTSAGVTPIYNAFMSPAWEEFPAAVEAFSTDRGRQSTTDEPKGGTAHVVFDNASGLLDPLAAGSVTAETFGCPVRLLAYRAGETSPDVIFTGLIDSSWKPSWGRGRRRTVEVDLSDWLARAAADDQPGCPANLRNHTWSGSPPHDEFVWWRGSMTATAAAPANNAEITDYGRGANHGQITAGLVTVVDPIAGCDMSSLQLDGGTTVQSSSVIPATPHVTASAALTLPDTALYTGDMPLLQFVSTAGKRRWSVGVDDAGHLMWQVCDSSGAPVVTHKSTFYYAGQSMICAITIDWAAGILHPWDGATVSFTGASASDGRLVLSGVTSGAGPVIAGNVAYAGGSTALRPLDVRAVKDTATVTIRKGTGTASATAQPVPIDMPPVAPRPTDAVDASTAVAVFAPGQAFWNAVATGIGGLARCRRDGWIVVRSADDLGWWPASRGPNDAVDDDLYEVIARITDEPNPAPIVGAVSGDVYDLPILRYSGPGHDGPDPERVINAVTIGSAQIVDPDSMRRYGTRPLSMTPSVSSAPGYIAAARSGSGIRVSGPYQYPIAVVPDDPMATQAAALVDARHDPTVATPQVTLQPYGDEAITAFVCRDLDLETRVLLTQSDQVTGTPLFHDTRVRVQGESWDWSAGGTEWTVTLDLAEPTPNK